MPWRPTSSTARLHAPLADARLPLFAHHPDCIAPEQLDAVLRDDVLVLATRYLQVGRTLAQQLLRRYAERGEITVPSRAIAGSTCGPPPWWPDAYGNNIALPEQLSYLRR